MTIPSATRDLPAAAPPPLAGTAHHAITATRAIWDQRQPGLVQQYYAPTSLTHTAAGTTLDRDALVVDIVARLAAFPQLRTYVADTIRAGNDLDGHRVSLRWTWVGRHTGDGAYGPPTGRGITVSGLTVWTLVGDEVTEQWSAHDEVGLLRQLGITARSHLHRLGTRGAEVLPEEALRQGTGRSPAHVPPGPPRTAQDPVVAAVHRYAEDVWNHRLVGDVDRYYAPRCIVHVGSDRVLFGADEVKADVLAWLCMLPDARLRVEDVLWQEASPGQRRRIATRWTLVGTHSGPSPYGAPTGHAVRVHGITHQWLAGGRVVEEWTEYSELSLLRQLLRPEHPPL